MPLVEPFERALALVAVCSFLSSRVFFIIFLSRTQIKIKGYPFEVALSGAGATGAALADQIKSLDWQSREAGRKGKATAAEMSEIKAKIAALLNLG